MRKCRNTPAKVQRQLRQDAYFGCCRCGHPLLDNAHIIPFRDSHAFPPEDMLALCPTCHRIADGNGYSEKYLRDLKANPKNKGSVSERFLIEGDDLVLNLGGNKFINCSKVLTVDSNDIIAMKKESGGYISLDLKLFDESNNLVALIKENKWTVNTSLVWDLEYKPKQLRIRNSERKIFFDLKIEHGEVFIEGNIFYLGEPIIVAGDEVVIQGKSFFNFMKNCTFKDLNTAINYQTRR